MSKTTKAIWGGTAGVAGLSVPVAIVVKKMLDSKQDNSNKNNEDSEHNKEIEKDLDDQKEKADNQDSKGEVKDPDSKSILLPLFIVLGLAVVVGTIVYFVCKGKRKYISLQHQKTSSDTFQHQKTINTFTNEESNNVNEFEVKKLGSEPKLELEQEDKAKKIYGKLETIGVDVKNVWTLEKLRRIFERSSNLVLETLLGKGDDELKTIWFCDENAKTEYEDILTVLFSESYGSTFIKFFEGKNESEKKELFSLLINYKGYSLIMLFCLFDALNKNGFDKINLTTKIAKILLENPSFTAHLSNVNEDRGRTIDFTAAILTGKYKEDQESFKVNICYEGEKFEHTFGNSPVDNLKALLSVYKKFKYEMTRIFFLEEVVRKYNKWKPEQQQQEYLNENNNI